MKTELKAKAQNYYPGSMSGFLWPKGDVEFMMIASWEKAKATIEQLLSDGKNINEVEMGLNGDWSENSMIIWSNGKFTQYDCYRGSTWAEPIIIVYYADGSNEAYSVWEK